MAQRLDPNADDAAGTYTSTPLYQKLDDGASADDGDFVSSSVASESAEGFTVGVSAPSSTPGAGTTTVTVRAKVTTGGLTDQIATIELFEGVTSRGNTSVALTTSFANYTFNPTGIVSYADLSVRFSFSNGDLGSAQTVSVSWIKVDVPDGSGGTAEILNCTTGVRSYGNVALRAGHQVKDSTTFRFYQNESLRVGSRKLVSTQHRWYSTDALRVSKDINESTSFRFYGVNGIKCGKDVVLSTKVQFYANEVLRIANELLSSTYILCSDDASLRIAQDLFSNTKIQNYESVQINLAKGVLSATYVYSWGVVTLQAGLWRGATTLSVSSTVALRSGKRSINANSISSNASVHLRFSSLEVNVNYANLTLIYKDLQRIFANYDAKVNFSYKDEKL